MKYLATLFSALFIVAATAQQMPYNPDANGDDFVGVDDVLGVLGVYDTALMQPDLQCDYEGTDIEQLIGGLFDQTLVLDSVYVEYLYSDSVLTYLPGCPDPVSVETILERSYVLDDFSFTAQTTYSQVFGSIHFLNFGRNLELQFWHDSGNYRVILSDSEIGSMTNFQSF